ncbi:5-aminolevulinate synthase [Lacimonas salitolerans]|uniref:5-aminolevulinate synthase n=1 Tax=Lacimonas salitolerans TaxID=1323750 RepID=A0ABW4E9B2_9RHOB
MDLFDSPSRVLLILLAAAGYAFAAIAMKLIAQSGTTQPVLFLLAAFFIVIVLTEVQLLRHMELSNVYIAILAAETLMILAYAVWAGEDLSTRELAGGGLVLVGIALAGA